MRQNVGKLDRAVRAVAGVVLLSFVFTVDEPVRWLGLAGLPLLASAFFGFCYAYKWCKCSSVGCCGSKSEAAPDANKPDGEKPAGHCGCGH